MKHLSRGLLAAVCATALLAPVAAADTVNLRVEGRGGTLFEGPIDTDARTIDAPDGQDDVAPRPCNYRDNVGDSSAPEVGNAMTAVYDAMRRTGQDYEARWFAFGDGGDLFAERLGSDEQTSSEFWGFFVDYRASDAGGCSTRVDSDDEVLWVYDAFSGRTLLELDGPSSVRAGEQATFTVTNGQNGEPVDGATVGGRETNSAGRVELTFSDTGSRTLKAEAPDAIRSNGVEIDVASAGAVLPAETGAAPGTTTVTNALAALALRSQITSIKRNQVFSRARSPRLLKGSVVAPNGVRSVKLRLTRTLRGRCTAFSAKRERWIRRQRCGARQGWWFRVGTSPEWQYQLPRRLPAGRYVLDVNVTDQAYNRDDPRRPGENRVVFHVR